MSSLTKVIVVLVNVMSIILVALVIAFVTNTEKLGDQLNQVQNELQTARSKANMAQSNLESERDQHQQQIFTLNNEINSLKGRLAELQAAKAEAETEVQQLGRQLNELNTNYTTLVAAEEKNSKLLENVTFELKDAQEKVVEQSKKLIELTMRNNELEGSLEGYSRQIRRIRESVQGYQQRINELETMFAGLSDDCRQQISQRREEQVAVVDMNVPIAGQVTAVDKATDDMTLLQVNVGQNDGVAKAMRFMVHRGDRYLGTLVIETVDATASAGYVELQQDSIKPGDSIYAGPY